MKKTWPAALRNADPITAQLQRVLSRPSTVVEVASGTGQHGAHFSKAMPDIQWQPTEYDEEALASIEEWRVESGADNLKAALQLDVRAAQWPIESADSVFCANMIHIAPWECCLGLLRGAGRILPSTGALLMYGPFIVSEMETAPSNLAFDQSLRSRNPQWGIRDLHEVANAADACELELEERISMPANNLMLVFRRR